MEIKKKQPKRWSQMLSVCLAQHPRAVKFFALVFLLSASFLGGIFFYRTAINRGPLNVWVQGKLIPMKRTNFKMIVNYFKGLRAHPEHIDIDVKFMDFQKLAYQRKQIATAATAWDASYIRAYVPAEIRHNGKTLKAKIRLKGDTPSQQVTADKWSFRIKIEGPDSLFGMKKLSIHHPECRNYLNEWIFHQALKREGVVSLRYKFVDLALNGKRLGIYALEEHFDKELIEANQHREGVIIKYDEDQMFASGGLYRTDEVFVKTFQNSNVDGFKMNKIAREQALFNQFKTAVSLLARFRDGELKTGEVFDIEIMAKHAALSELLAAHHGLHWYNRRFYYNPITSKLEPIGFDADAGRKIAFLYCNKPFWSYGPHVYSGQGSFPDLLFSDINFFEQYIRYLKQVSEPAYVDALLEDLNEEMENNLNIIYKDQPYYAFSPEFIYANQSYIKKVLNPVKAINAYFSSASENSIQLEIGNIHLLPVKLISVSWKDSVIFKPAEEIILQRAKASQPIKFQTIEFLIPQELSWNKEIVQDLQINYSILGTQQVRREPVFFWPRQDMAMIKQDLMRKQANYHLFSFLTVDNLAKTITIQPGQWQVTDNLVIPPGFIFICPPGVQLDLRHSATILSYSPCRFLGREDNPIIISSADSSGEGFIVIKADKKSRLEYVVFHNLAAPRQPKARLSGAVTFYESAVEISHCRFLKNRDSDDALNIIRSDFIIDGSLFSRTAADALDADFCKGRISDSQFISCGNDGIDVSGSIITVDSILIDGAEDKGISVGEKSQVEINEAEIRNARIAVAGKDNSRVDLTESTIADCEIGFAVYQKKPEFGPAVVNVGHLQKRDIRDVQQIYLVEQGSSLNINGITIQGSHKNLGATLDAEGQELNLSKGQD